MLNLVRKGEEDYIEAIRYRRRLKIFENFLLLILSKRSYQELHTVKKKSLVVTHRQKHFTSGYTPSKRCYK